ncbi:MAG: hypothetical protein ACM30G_10885 [Micromonosporaceae bacterium]
MISGRTERPAAIGVPLCPEQTGPVWKLRGETCGCVLPASHLDDPTSDHECSCGAWWARHNLEESHA